jgi:Uncharacterized membrane protein (DUF2298)
MQHLGLLFSLAVLGINLWGLMLATGLYWRNRWFAFAAGPIVGVTAIYAIECHHGLGRSLTLLGILSTIASLALIALAQGLWTLPVRSARLQDTLARWRTEFAPGRAWAPAALFAAVFSYEFLWRFTSPDIDGSSEKIADFSYICSYFAGSTLPVPDAWLHPFLSTQYYSYQHYAAALMGRVLGLLPGTTYNLALCVLVGLCGAAMAGAVALVVRRTWVRVLLILGFVIGGTGMTLVVHATDKDVQPWTSMRFIGSAPMDRAPLGPLLKAYQDKYTHMELPGEIFSYVAYLGDYHPPISGYYLMGLGAMGIILSYRTGLRRYAAFVGATITWTLLADTWVLPLTGIAVVAWLGLCHRQWRTLVPSVAFGAALVWLLSWVYLSAFTQSAASYGAALRPVPWSEHTPPLLLLLFMLPTVALILLSMASGAPRGLALGLGWLGVLLFSEYFYIDDIYSGMYDRFNTTLKWWPWVSAGALVTLGPVVLEHSPRRWVRWVGFLFCFYPCLYIADLWRPFLGGPRDSIGKLEGSHYLERDEFARLMLARLRVEPVGVVVERPEKEGGFTNSAVLPLMAGQKMWLGWFGHELLWRGFSEDIRRRHDRLDQLYAGTMPDAGHWLAAQGIDYVLWYRAGDTPELWGKVNDSIGPGYGWTEILAYEDGRRVGFWRRKAAP